MKSKIICFLNRLSYIMVIVITVILIINCLQTQIKISYFKLSFYEGIYIIFVIINLILLIEIYNFFVKKTEENKKKEEFIFKQLEILQLELQTKELKHLETQEDYKKYLITQRKITNLLELIEKICIEYNSSENVVIELKKIKENFEKYKSKAAENIPNYESFNKEASNYEKKFQNMEMSIYLLQGIILNFNVLKKNQ